MISFVWNTVEFNIVDIGGGRLEKDIAGHSHSKNGYELHFITGGKGTLVTRNKEYDLKKGDFFVTGPNFYHAQKTNAENPTKDIFIYLQKASVKTNNTFADVFLRKNFYFVRNFNAAAAANMLEEHRAKRPDYKSAVAGMAMTLLTGVVRLYMPEEFAMETDNDNLYDKRFVIIENSFLYNKNITLLELSEKIGVCPRQTQRLLKKYYGKSFREKKSESKNALGAAVKGTTDE